MNKLIFTRKYKVILMVVGFSLALMMVGYAMGDWFDKSDYRERRERLAELASDGVIIITNTPSQGTASAEFYYLTGVEVSGARLIIIPPSIAAKASHPEFWQTTLYLPPKDPRAGVWDDPELFAGEEAREETGIENVVPLDRFYSDLIRLGALTDTIYLPLRGGISQMGELSPDLRFAQTLKSCLPGAKVKNLLPLINQLRWKKSPQEIAILRRACQITSETVNEVMRFARPEQFEYELEALVKYIFRKEGSQQAAFTIIGSGPNSCILHHSRNDRKMEPGELVVVDVGTIYHYYSSDLTRTIPVSGKFTLEQKKIYNIVLEAQKKAISVTRPGATLAEVHLAAMEVIDEAGYGKYFIHGTSHSINGGSGSKPTTIGLLITGQYGKYPMNRSYAADNPLVPGSVFTIEPGIYIPEKNLGIRIEDDILVTEDGCEVLTAGSPKEVEEIERLMTEKPKYVQEVK